MDDLGTGLPGGREEIDGPVRRISDPEILERRPFAPDSLHDQENEPPGDEGYAPNEPSPEAEEVERQLAHYAFVREEREREVRLSFRDVPADEVAAAFRAAGASLITMAGERAAPPVPEPKVGAPGSKSSRRRRKRTGPQPLGALSLRYFYALGDLVYTITITAPSEVVRSIAPIFPVAALSERELNERMAVVFHRVGMGTPDYDEPEPE